VVDADTFLSAALGLGFLSLGALAAVQWRRRGDPPSPYIALALASIGVITVAGVIEDIIGTEPPEVVEIASLVFFMASAYFLLLFRHSILPVPLWARGLALAAVIASLAALLLYPLPEGENPNYTGIELVIVFSVIGVWIVCVGEPTVTFWRVSKNRPRVQRARLRALSGAYAGLILIILVALTASVGGSQISDVTTTAFALALVPLLWTALAPPQWLRRAWRAREEEFRLIEDLAVYANDRHEIAQRSLNRALRLAGADEGFIVDSQDILAVEGLDQEEVARHVAARAVEGAPEHWREARGRHVVTISLRSERGDEVMGIVSGPIAPLFGSDELLQLTRYAEVVGVALARVQVIEQLRDQTESNEALLQALSDLGEGFVVTEAGHLDYANDAYLRMTGYTLEELQALPSLLELSLPEERAELAERLRKRLEGGAVSDHYEAGMLTKDGRVVETEAAVKLLQTPRGPRVISIVRDISQRKRAEAFRDQFIANAAHELRTPITAMVGFASLLEKRRNEMSEAELDTISDALNRQGERLRLLVANLLDLTRLQQGKLPLEMTPLPLDEVLKDVVESNPAPEDKSVTIESPEDLLVLADRLRLDQIVTNLLTNAYRYGGRSIALQAAANKSHVTVSVADDGRGVPGELVPSLFEPFARGEDSARVGGSGLGLAIVRMMARAQGGDVWYEHSKPSGSRFLFTLRRP
jgi:PAS domain S-box-containing protein